MSSAEVDDNDLLLRRFDPQKTENFTTDEAGLPSRLRQSALFFDETPEAYECSVYQDSKLEQLGLQRADCIEAERPTWMLATATAAQVRSVKRATVPADPNPFSVLEDEYPRGREDIHPRDGAHAVIAHDKGVRGRDKWYTLAAAEFSVLGQPGE